MTSKNTERGSLSIWAITSTVAITLLVGLAVDLGGQVHAQQRTHDVAAQAARAGAQRVNAPAAIQGRDVGIDPSAAQTAAKEYLDVAGVHGSATFDGGDTITVHARDTYETRFLGIIGINQLTVNASAKARIVRTVGGTEQ